MGGPACRTRSWCARISLRPLARLQHLSTFTPAKPPWPVVGWPIASMRRCHQISPAKPSPPTFSHPATKRDSDAVQFSWIGLGNILSNSALAGRVHSPKASPLSRGVTSQVSLPPPVQNRASPPILPPPCRPVSPSCCCRLLESFFRHRASRLRSTQAPLPCPLVPHQPSTAPDPVSRLTFPFLVDCLISFLQRLPDPHHASRSAESREHPL